MIKSLIILLAFFIFSCSNSPNIYKTNGTVFLKNRISDIINSSNLSTNLGIKAISLKTGQTLFDLNSNSLFNPASNNKIYTCLSALALLDSNYYFKTEVFEEGNDLYLVGGANPDLTLDELDSLASVIASKISGVKRLILDDSILDQTVYGRGWMWDEGSWWYAAQISGLSVNDNCVDFIVRPGDLGKNAIIQTKPESNYYKIINNSITVNDTIDFQEFKIDRDWQNGTNTFMISGNILDTTSIDTIYRNIHDPTYYTGNLFMEALIRKGIDIKSIIKGKNKSTAKRIGVHQSKNIKHTLKNLMVESDNLTAELVLKIIGFESNQSQGDWESGLIELRKFLNDKVGLDTTSFSISDGSGISRYNYSSPNHFVHTLKWAYNNESIKDNFINSLPKGGEDGTLKERNLPSNAYMKTGSLSGVSTLSGYIINKNADTIVFSILMNGFEGSPEPYNKLQDQIVRALSEYK